MIFESEFLILTILVFSLTAAYWCFASGFSFSLADLTAIDEKPKQSIHRAGLKAHSALILLPSQPVTAQPSPFNAEAKQIVELPPGAIPLDSHSQLDRVSQILETAIELAGKAERLHNAAHEQLDSAHYALQNLLDELSTVMAISSPAAALRDKAPASASPARRPAYVTALAA